MTTQEIDPKVIEILNACGGWLKFASMVTKHRKDGMDNDLAARQIVDNLFRAGHRFQFQQHLVEAMAGLVPGPVPKLESYPGSDCGAGSAAFCKSHPGVCDACRRASTR